MKISIVGTGYVGLVTAACFSELGIDVTCVDTDLQKINRLVYGSIPIYEPELENMMTHNVNDKRLHFSTDFNKGFENVDYVFCTVDPTPDADGATDLEPVLRIARIFGQRIDRYCTFVIKTTVPVGTVFSQCMPRTQRTPSITPRSTIILAPLTSPSSLGWKISRTRQSIWSRMA